MHRPAFGLVLVLMIGAATLTHAAQSPEPTAADWAPVQEALGKAGQVQPGGVFRIAMPRTDLKVSVQGIEVKPGFALGSYAAFARMSRQTMVMGDLVLLDEE